MNRKPSLGQMIQEQKAGEGVAKGASEAGTRRGVEPTPRRVPTLAEAIDLPTDAAKKLSLRCQSLASMPDEEFEDNLSEWRDEVKSSEKVAHPDRRPVWLRRLF